jgi:uncharacterized protein YukE
MTAPSPEVPGDPLALEELAGQWMGLANALGDVIGHLGVANRITGPDHWVGDGASRFAEWWMNIDPELRTMADAFQNNGVTLRRLADEIGDMHRLIASRAAAGSAILGPLPSDADPMTVARAIHELDQPWPSASARFRANGDSARDLRTILRDETSARFVRAVALPATHGPVVGIPGVTLTAPPKPWYDTVKDVLSNVADLTGKIALVTMVIPGIGEVTLACELALLASRFGKTAIDAGKAIAGEGNLKDAVGDTADFLATVGAIKVGELVKAGKFEEAVDVQRFLQSVHYSGAEAERVTVEVVKSSAEAAYEAGRIEVEQAAGEQPWTIGGPWPEPG